MTDARIELTEQELQEITDEVAPPPTIPSEDVDTRRRHQPRDDISW